MRGGGPFCSLCESTDDLRRFRNVPPVTPDASSISQSVHPLIGPHRTGLRSRSPTSSSTSLSAPCRVVARDRVRAWREAARFAGFNSTMATALVRRSRSMTLSREHSTAIA